ncbi:unnamed protein product [Cyclocybe aegerita]|uniref:Exonuclease domain-containing protein n=1 Tax=Cyclocybe aegerita TaxID=1973307 RepID=A0A8S0W651_CYCAE|nr:unnamed protein product [Cyclocybe aegerita]
MAPPPAIDRFLAISCTNVGVGPGGTTNLVARVAIVDYRGTTVFDKYVRPTTTVTDYRTASTGLTEAHLYSADAWQFGMIQTYLSNLFRGKILVGHSLWHDLAVLGLPHPAVDTRDVALYQLENARAALDLYRSDADAWEAAISNGNWPCALPPSTFSRCYI